MTSSRVTDYVDRMLEAATQACAYVEGMSKEEFLADKRTQQAVVLNLILIGEEATKLLKDNEAFADLHSQVPWRSMKARAIASHMVISRSILIPCGTPYRRLYPA